MVKCHWDPELNSTVSVTWSPSTSPFVGCAARLAAESGGISGSSGIWAEAIEPHASASIGNPKINFVIVFITLFSVVRTSLSFAVTLRKEGQEAPGGDRLTDLARERLWQMPTKTVNMIFANKYT